MLPGQQASDSHTLGIVAGVIVTVVVVLLAVILVTGHLGGGGGGGGGPGSSPTSSGAASSAEGYANSTHPGGNWRVSLIEGISLSNSTYVGSGSCVLWYPGDGGSPGAGTAPTWVVGLVATNGTTLVLLVENGTVSTFSSACFGGGVTTVLPNGIIDSSVASSSALSAGGSAFLSEYPHANAIYVVATEFGYWEVLYNTCHYSTSTTSTIAPEFYVDVNYLTGTASGATTTTIDC